MAHRLLNRHTAMNRRARSEAGFSLAEMLVVLAIIGIMTLVAVPNFMSFYRSSKLKASMRQITVDLRGARQHAVSSNHMTKLHAILAVNPGKYAIYDSPDGGTTWNQYQPTQATDTTRLQAPAYFADSNLKDGTGTYADFVFLADGTTQLPSGTSSGTLVIKTTDNVPNNAFTISVYPTGKISAK